MVVSGPLDRRAHGEASRMESAPPARPREPGTTAWPLYRAGDAGREPPPTDRNITASRSGTWRMNSRPSVAVPSAVSGPSNGCTNVRPSSRSIASHLFEGLDAVHQHDVGAVGPAESHAGGVGRAGHDHRRAGPHPRGGERHRRGVIARAHRGDTARQLLARERPHIGKRPAGLEASRCAAAARA